MLYFMKLPSIQSFINASVSDYCSIFYLLVTHICLNSQSIYFFFIELKKGNLNCTCDQQKPNACLHDLCTCVRAYMVAPMKCLHAFVVLLHLGGVCDLCF